MTYLSPLPPSKDEHIEIYRRSNEDEDKGGNIFIFISNVLTISIAAVISIPLVLKIFEEFNLINEFDSILNIEETISQPDSPSSGGGQPRYPRPSDSHPTSQESPSIENHVSRRSWNSNHRRVLISECNGVRLEGANLREYPSSDSQSIKGVVLAGTWVTLTGLNAHTDGMTWYEVINEFDVFSSTQPDRTRLIGSDQIGWIAGCFVES